LEVAVSGKKGTTEKVSRRFCAHAKTEVTLKSKLIFPADIMPDQPPRITSRQCSHYFDCNLLDKDACSYAVQMSTPVKPE
jgi:hypothetical protein